MYFFFTTNSIITIGEDETEVINKTTVNLNKTIVVFKKKLDLINAYI